MQKVFDSGVTNLLNSHPSLMRPPLSLSPRVLLVIDSRDGLLVRRSLLEEAGCRVQIAANGEEGLKLFTGTPFDVVVTDYRMPGMSGVDLIRGIREIDPKARVILISGFVEPLGLTEAGTGANVVIAKSASEPAHLVRWVKRLMSRQVTRKPPASQKRLSGMARAASG
jgi:CheY-like chemotaxis protein